MRYHSHSYMISALTRTNFCRKFGSVWTASVSTRPSRRSLGLAKSVTVADGVVEAAITRLRLAVAQQIREGSETMETILLERIVIGSRRIGGPGERAGEPSSSGIRQSDRNIFLSKPEVGMKVLTIAHSWNLSY
ncbi:MAG: hypothetical protein OXL40_11435 [Bacteroidota bacterium]|nr:hypothetical protein [Bacteroidota bacterium]